MRLGGNTLRGFKSPILRSEVFTLRWGLFSRLGSASPREYRRLGPGQMRPRVSAETSHAIA